MKPHLLEKTYPVPRNGSFIDDTRRYHHVGGKDETVLKPDGTPLLIFRHDVLPQKVCTQAFPALHYAAMRHPTLNRGDAAGGERFRAKKRDGTLSNTITAKKSESAIIGFYDRTRRLPFCRTTAFTATEVRRWRRILPLVESINEVFATSCPERHEAQMAAVRETPPDWVIPGTAFTTLTVNRNWRTAVHTDKGDLAEGFGVLSVVRSPGFHGGYLLFPKYRVAVDMRTRDVLLSDVHEAHCNSPMIATETDDFERISVVLYFRSKMVNCYPPAEEIRWAKDRLPGEPLDSNRRPIGRNLPGETLAQYLRREIGDEKFSEIMRRPIDWN